MRMRRDVFGGAILLLMTVMIASCKDDPADPGGGGGATGQVNEYLLDLPGWAAFTADVNGPDVPPAPVGSPDTLPIDSVTVHQIEEDSSVTVIPDQKYRCTEQEFSVRKNPTQIVMLSPDKDVVFVGALIQGKSRKQLGSLAPLPIQQRAPIQVSIPTISSGDNFRLVDSPSQATIDAARGEIVGNAVQSGLATPSSITFRMEVYHSEESFGLSTSLSGHYLGFSASASGDFSRNASETTIAATFYQKMYDVVIQTPQTPASMFSSAFTQARLQEQINSGAIGPDNPPIYVSSAVYGRMMMFSLTSTASEEEIRGTISAAYNGIGGGASGSLSAKQAKILQTAKIAVTSIGGDAQATLDLIRSGDWSQYFTNNAPLNTAEPLSYSFRNLGDNSPAGVTETTNYTVRDCEAIASTPGTFSFRDLQSAAAAFTGGVRSLTGDVDGDGRIDLIWNQLEPTGNRVYVGMAVGDGTFTITTPVTHPVNPPEGWGNYSVNVADINGDGRADLVWNHLGTNNKTYVGVGNGDGTFGFPSVRTHTATGPWTGYTLRVGDAAGATGSGDGQTDLIWVRNLSSTLGIYLGRSLGNSEFEFVPFQQLAGSFSSAWVPRRANVDGDPDDDIVLNLLSGATNSTYVVRSNGNGTWTQMGPFNNTRISNWNGYARHSGDVTGLGSEALIWTDTANVHKNAIAVGRWTGSTFTFLVADSADLQQSVPLRTLVGDVDGDGDADVVWNTTGSTNRTSVSLGRGDGTFDFAPADQLHPATGENWDQYTMHVADVNGDGRDDIVWNWHAATNRIHVGLARP